MNIWNAKEEAACYRLANMQGVGNKSIFRLLEQAKSAVNIFELSENDIRENLDVRSADNFLRQRDKKFNGTVQELYDKARILFVPITSPQYPQCLRNIPDAPFCLYVKGELPDDIHPAVAIIGARACSEYGKSVAEYFGKRLGNCGVQIISGMARGIDGIAQRGALEGGGKTFAVLGCGVDVCYPADNYMLYQDIQKKGGIISEYPPGTQAKSCLFPLRNRIISGLADVILVIEARKRSGTYITVTQALEQGKDVFAVPGRITDSLSEGCNYLLSQGAGMAIEPEIIIELLMSKYGDWNKRIDEKETNFKLELSKREKLLNDRQMKILETLEITPTEIQKIYEKIKLQSGISMQELIYEMTQLQILGLVSGEGNYYRVLSTL